MPVLLTHLAACGDTGRSLKSLAAPRRLAVKPDFFRPHSVRRARARLARSMGDAGTRKGPAAPTCGETSPTPFGWLLNLSNVGGTMPKTSPAVQANKQFSALETSGRVARLAFLDTLSPEIRELIVVAESMHRHGQLELIGMARFLHGKYPKIPGAATVLPFPRSQRAARVRKGGAA